LRGTQSGTCALKSFYAKVRWLMPAKINAPPKVMRGAVFRVSSFMMLFKQQERGFVGKCLFEFQYARRMPFYHFNEQPSYLGFRLSPSAHNKPS
jgi:hypothetical protein